jgi:hypothetical protein
MGVYATTKAFVTSFSEALRSEVRGHGITVSALCPGPVHTEFDSIARRADDSRQPAPPFTYVPVDHVVCEALAGIESDRPIVIPGAAIRRRCSSHA